MRNFVDASVVGCDLKRCKEYLQVFCPRKLKGWNCHFLENKGCERNTFYRKRRNDFGHVNLEMP